MHQVNPEVMTSGQWLLEGKCHESSADELRADPGTTLPLPKPPRLRQTSSLSYRLEERSLPS